MKKLLCVCLAALHLTACTTLNSTPYTAEALEKKPIREKEKVVLTTKDYTLHRMFVTRVTPEEICESQKCVRTEDINVVQREEISIVKTAAAVLLIAVILAVPFAGSGGSLAGANFKLWGL